MNPQQPQNPYQAPGANPGVQAAPVTPMTTKDLLFGANGRIGRKQFWMAFLIYILGGMIAVGIVAGILSAIIGEAALILVALAYIPVVWISICLQIKRWHDRNKSGWWCLLSFVPIVSIWAFIETGFLRGTSGPNQFGEDPLQ